MNDELVRGLARYTDAHPGAVETEIAGVRVLRADRRRRPRHFTFKPALCFIAQGAKGALFGDRTVSYGACKALVGSVELPGVGWVTEASAEKPMLGLILELDVALLREVYEQMDDPPAPGSTPRQGVLVTDCTGPLTECVARIVRLFDTPRAVGVVYPAIMREIGYWLLAGPQGSEIAQMVLSSGHSAPIVRALHALRAQFHRPVRLEELAAAAHLSPSAFHRQFKELTSMTPLQYQKQLRLLEARRLMVTEAMSAATAAFQVGYESASQFSREYTRMFGQSPRRDVASVLTASG